MSPRDAINPLALAYHFDGLESEGAIKFVMRGRPTATALSEQDLALADDEPGFGFALTRAQETDLPLASRIAYIDSETDYRQAVVEARRLVAASDRIASSTLPIVMDQGQAGGIGARLLQDAWEARETATFALPPSRLALDPADEVLLTAGGRTHRLRLLEVDDAGLRNIRAEATDPSIYEALTGPMRNAAAGSAIAQTGRAIMAFLDLPLLTGTEVPWQPHAAAYANPWPGAELIYRSASDANVALDTSLTTPATLGVTTQDFASGPLWRWDNANELYIRLSSGTLSSQDDLSVFGGANAVAVQNETGAWEVVQFANAELTAPNAWKLTKLLRGQGGTESAMGTTAGARVVLLDSALEQLNLSQAEYALPFNVRYGPAGKELSDPAFQSASLQFEGIGLRPYAPVQLKTAWSGADLILSWIRRDRAPSADIWDQTEIPLSEASETYDIEILNASTVIRTLTATTPTVTYAAADIATDFPSGLSTFSFRVYQVSNLFGRGSAGAQ